MRRCDQRQKIRGQKSCLESFRVPVRYLLPAAEIRARSYWLQPNSKFGSIDSYSPKPPMIRNRTSNLSVSSHYYFADAAPASTKAVRSLRAHIPNAWIKPAKHFGRALSNRDARASEHFPFPALSDRCNSIRPVLALCAAGEICILGCVSKSPLRVEFLSSLQ